MIMTYVSDSVFYTDGTDYYCQVYFSPDEIVALCPGVQHLYVISRVRKKDDRGIYKRITWNNCTVEFVNIEDEKGRKAAQLIHMYRVSKKLCKISDVSYLKFCFISSYIYGALVKKRRGQQICFSHMVGDPDCILSFSSSKVKSLLLSMLNRLQKRWYRAIAKKMDLQIFVSEKLREKYAVSGVKTAVVNENRFREKDIVAAEDIRREHTGELKLLFVGRLSPEKRVDDLFAVLREQEDVSLSIVGDGPLKEELMTLAEQQGVAHKVSFLGRRQWGDDLFTEMKKYDVLVLPSENEGLPLVIAEAMGCGLTVIASRVGGIPEIVRHEKNGLLFDKGDLAMLSQAMDRMKDADFRAACVAEAIKTAQAFSFDHQHNALRYQIESILRKQ